MTTSLTVFFFILLAAYLLAMGWYLRAVIVLDRKPSSHKPYETTRRRRKRKSGKKCPGCGKTIDHRRRICQYCAQTFEVAPDVEIHPDELLQNKFESRRQLDGEAKVKETSSPEDPSGSKAAE